MAGKEGEVRSGLLEKYKKFNKLTLAGSLTVAFFVPALVIPALSLAAVDVGQIVIIDKLNKKKQNQKEQIVYQAGGA